MATSLESPLSVAWACFIFLHSNHHELLSAGCLSPPVLYALYILAEVHCRCLSPVAKKMQAQDGKSDKPLNDHQDV